MAGPSPQNIASQTVKGVGAAGVGFTITLDARSAKANVVALTQALRENIKAEKDIYYRRRAAINASLAESSYVSRFPGFLQGIARKYYNARSSGGISLGAEGLRVGDVRFSRSGIGLSEKTLVGTGPTAFAAVAGQFLGAAGRHSVEARDAYRKAKATMGADAAYGVLADSVFAGAFSMLGGLTAQVESVFGIDQVAASTIAWLTDSSYDVALSAWRSSNPYNLVADLYTPGRIRDREAAELSGRLSVDIGLMNDSMATQAKVRSKRLFRNPQTAQAQAELIRDELGQQKYDDRIMVRDLANRPLWKVAGVPAEGS